MESRESEDGRRALQTLVNENPQERARLEAEYGKDNVWDTEQLKQDFEVLAFAAPFCVVRRRLDGAKGSLMFQHHPRFYYEFRKDERG